MHFVKGLLLTVSGRQVVKRLTVAIGFPLFLQKSSLDGAKKKIVSRKTLTARIKICRNKDAYASFDLANLVFSMGNEPVKQGKEEILVKVMPPLDRAFVKWLARDLERIHGFTVKNQPAIRPPDHYIEYMRLCGWLDVDLDDPDIARLLK